MGLSPDGRRRNTEGNMQIERNGKIQPIIKVNLLFYWNILNNNMLKTTGKFY